MAMPINGYQTYLENEILSASPLRLIQMLYAAALESLRSARRSVRSGEIRARSHAITKTMRIVTELHRCLNRDTGGEVSKNLANVYGYVLRLLMESNAKQTEAPLAEAESLLATLAEAWIRCVPPQLPPADQDNATVHRPDWRASETRQPAL